MAVHIRAISGEWFIKGKGMRKHSIRSRVYISILIAVFVQSIIFGVALIATGVYPAIEQEPYRILQTQLEEKNHLISINMNNTLMEGESLARQLVRLDSQEAINNRLVECLSRQTSLSGIFYSNIAGEYTVYYQDHEPSIHTVGYGDIACKVGQAKTDNKIALDSRWRAELSGEEKSLVSQYLENANQKSQWCYYEGALYYVMLLEQHDFTSIMALELNQELMEGMLKIDRPAYAGMRVVIMQGDVIRYDAAGQLGEPDLLQELQADENGRFDMNINGVQYVGIRSQLQSYGRIESDTKLYCGILCQEASLSALGRRVTILTLGAYLASLIIASIVAYIAVGMVMRPLNQLHLNIKKQNVQKIHFDTTGAVEIDAIYDELNVMTSKLERSYARYALAMEAAGENLGSFEYQYGKDVVTVSPSIRHILNLSDDCFIEENTMKIENWMMINTCLQPVEGLEGYLYQDQNQNIRYVSVRTKEEAGGIFGVLIDKTEEYMKISRLQYLSEHDHLTGLFNGEYFRKEGQKLLGVTGWKRGKKTVQAVVYCDLDNLKHVNDCYGHQGGDWYLCGMADWMRTVIDKENAIAARMSGDEFAILFYGYDCQEEIVEHMQNAYENRKKIMLPNEVEVTLSASIGISFHMGNNGDMEQLLRRADEAMYQQKRSAKNGIFLA